MTVSKKPGWRTFRADFKFLGKRYEFNTYQITRTDAELVEREKQLALRHQAGGISQFFPHETPRFSAWANTFLAYQEAHTDRPDHATWITGVLLRFFGAAPKGAEKTPETPFHNLRLGDVIADASWILKFEEWLTRRGLGAQSKKHYRSMMRRMYRLAMQPQYRNGTGITTNPFIGLLNEPTPGRTAVITPAEAREWMAYAPYHVRVAIAIAALAPKLRLANILGLQWADIAPDPRETLFKRTLAYYITVRRHKTVRKTGRPLVASISKQLLGILKEAYAKAPTSPYVVTYHGQPVENIRAGVREAAQAAGLTYGRDNGGVTFHSLRHTAATLISRDEVDPLKLRDAIGHSDLSTTLKYRHMEPKHERPTLERLSKRLKLSDVMTATRSGPVLGAKNVSPRKDGQRRKTKKGLVRGAKGRNAKKR